MLQKIMANRPKDFHRCMKVNTVIGMNIEYLMENKRLNGYMRS
jgi:hypothetical protein